MRKLIILFLAFLYHPVFGAIANTVQWEVETGGSDTNGGGFNASASGTDWSKQSSPQYSVTDGVTGVSTTITSATANFGTDVVGNIIYVAGGSGSVTAQWREITARTNSTTITVDANLTVSTGVTLKIGGALLTIQQGMNNLTADQVLWIKSGTYSISSAITESGAGPSNYSTQVSGYSSTRGDEGRPTISVTAAVKGLDLSQAGYYFSNLIIDGTNTGTIGINVTGNFNNFYNISIKNFTTGGSNTVVTTNYYRVEVSGSGYGLQGGMIHSYCYIHDNTGPGIEPGSGGVVNGCILANNSGGSSDGVHYLSYNTMVINSIFYNNGRSGIYSDAVYGTVIGSLIHNNIFVNNGGYGIEQINANAFETFPFIDRNAFYNNTSGAMRNINSNGNDFTLTASPFVNAASGNWALNNTAGGGAALRGLGFPGQLPGLSTTTGYLDVGAIQHQDSGSTIAIINE